MPVVCGPGVEVPVCDAIGSYTLSRPNSLFKMASLLVASVSLGVVYGLGMSGPGDLLWGWWCQCEYWVSSAKDVTTPVILACSCLFWHTFCHSDGSCLLSASAFAHFSFSKTSANREWSYSSSVAFSRSFRVVWHCCCQLNSVSLGSENNAQALSQS